MFSEFYMKKMRNVYGGLVQLVATVKICISEGKNTLQSLLEAKMPLPAAAHLIGAAGFGVCPAVVCLFWSSWVRSISSFKNRNARPVPLHLPRR